MAADQDFEEMVKERQAKVQYSLNAMHHHSWNEVGNVEKLNKTCNSYIYCAAL